MNPLLSDTNKKAGKVLIDLIRQRNISERLRQMQSLTSLIMRLSKRAIARNNEGKTKRELDLLFVKLNYGEELYEKVRDYLIKIDHEKK